MGKISSIEDYIELHPKWAEELRSIASILEETEMKATIKWNAPVYTINGKNVVGMSAFKNHYGIWFFNGVFLSDPKKILINAQEEKTKALRQVRFEVGDAIDKELIKSYLLEAIENEKQGKKITPGKAKQESIIIPELLNEVIRKDPDLKSKFNNLSNYKQKEYCEYINTAKRDNTKSSRLKKIIPMIKSGIGLNDKYRK